MKLDVVMRALGAQRRASKNHKPATVQAFRPRLKGTVEIGPNDPELPWPKFSERS